MPLALFAHFQSEVMADNCRASSKVGQDDFEGFRAAFGVPPLPFSPICIDRPWRAARPRDAQRSIPSCRERDGGRANGRHCHADDTKAQSADILERMCGARCVLLRSRSHSSGAISSIAGAYFNWPRSILPVMRKLEVTVFPSRSPNASMSI